MYTIYFLPFATHFSMLTNLSLPPPPHLHPPIHTPFFVVEGQAKERAQNETVWEKYQRERDEKRAARRRDRRQSGKAGSDPTPDDDDDGGEISGGTRTFEDDEVDVDPNDPFFAEAFGKGKGGGSAGKKIATTAASKVGAAAAAGKVGAAQKKSKAELAEEKRQRAQLELLMMSGAEGAHDQPKQGYN
jgi:hypothetical protein